VNMLNTECLTLLVPLDANLRSRILTFLVFDIATN
jgi:hypothetical protein